MPLVQDLRDTGNAVAFGVDASRLDVPLPADATESPGALDTFAAAFRVNNTVSDAVGALTFPDDSDKIPAPPGWDPLDNLEGYEAFAHQAAFIQNPAELAAWKQKVDEEQSDRQTLSRAGWTGVGATIVAGALDPTFLVSMAVPEAAMGRSVRFARAVQSATSAGIGVAAQEVALQQFQQTRPVTESLVNITSGALLGGVLGSLGRNVPAAEMRAVREAVGQELQRSEAGAAAVARPTTLEAESLARGGNFLSKKMNKLPLLATDLDKVMSTDSITLKQTLSELADVPGLLGKNADGIATAVSVESRVDRWNAQLADLSDTMRDGWKEYRDRVPSSERLSRDEFYAQVSASARRGDTHVHPEIARAAQFLRSEIFDPLWEQAKKLGISKEEGEQLFAQSYFRRMYDREAIRANRAGWDALLVNHFVRDGAERVEATAAAQDLTRKILGGDVGQANYSVQIDVPAAGPLKGRTLSLPDEVLEPFLVNDPMKVATAYVRDLAPQVELARRFGDVEMKDALAKVSDEYAIMAEKVREKVADVKQASKKLTELEQQEKAGIEAMVRIRDRILGRAGRLAPDASDSTRRAVAASRGWRNFVASGRLGATAITGGVMDTTRIAAQYGFLPTVSKLAKLATSAEYRALSHAQARRVGSAVEVALSRRVNVAYDGAITEGWTQAMANGLYKYTGLNHITDFNRTLAATLLEDKILKVAGQIAEGGRPAKFDLTRLASLGFDEQALREVHAQVGAHGGEVGGTRVSGSADWTNKGLSDRYDAAILRESKIVVQQPGAADRVWWMDKETGKFFGQLKSFSLSAPMRLLSAPLQAAGQGAYGTAARLVGYMMMGGYLTHAIRQTLAGRTPETNPAKAAAEAFTETGMAGVLPDIVSPFARMAGFNGGARYADRNLAATFGGPAAGALQDLLTTGSRLANGVSASDLHAVRRLLPWQNAWMFRRAVNALEGEAAEGMGLEGADSASFGQRLLRTEALSGPGQIAAQ